jgi:hypothetical protein
MQTIFFFQYLEELSIAILPYSNQWGNPWGGELPDLTKIDEI